MVRGRKLPSPVLQVKRFPEISELVARQPHSRLCQDLNQFSETASCLWMPQRSLTLNTAQPVDYQQSGHSNATHTVVREALARNAINPSTCLREPNQVVLIPEVITEPG